MQSLGTAGFRRRARGGGGRSARRTTPPSGVALVGGGSNPRPGEISLAHHGVLFLDELPEFDRSVLEVLREPLEIGRASRISRAARQADFPARFQLVAAMNPCPCGYLGHHSGRCRCTPDQIARYRARISGPLLDRIDLQIEVPSVPGDRLVRAAGGRGLGCDPRPGGGGVRARACAPGQSQRRARRRRSGSALRARPRRRTACCARRLEHLGLSARGYHRMLKIARTVADLAGGRPNRRVATPPRPCNIDARSRRPAANARSGARAAPRAGRIRVQPCRSTSSATCRAAIAN